MVKYAECDESEFWVFIVKTYTDKSTLNRTETLKISCLKSTHCVQFENLYPVALFGDTLFSQILFINRTNKFAVFVLLPKTQRLKDIKTQNNEQVKLVSREGFV